MFLSMHKPLSPHLSVYKWQITNTLSILHRIAGVGLFFGISLFAIFFVDFYYNGTGLMHSLLSNKVTNFIVNAFLVCICIGFSYHFANGIRFLYFDITTNISIRSIRVTAYIMLVFAVLLLAFLFFIVFK